MWQRSLLELAQLSVTIKPVEGETATGYHESLTPSYHVLGLVREMAEDGVPSKWILWTLEQFDQVQSLFFVEVETQCIKCQAVHKWQVSKRAGLPTSLVYAGRGEEKL